VLKRPIGITAEGAVVDTITDIGTLVVAFVRVAEDDGEKLQEAPVGNPEQARFTVPVKPFTAVTVMLTLSDGCPGEGTVAEGLEDVR